MNIHFKQIISTLFSVVSLLILSSSFGFSQDCGQADFIYTINSNTVKLTGKSTLSDTAKFDWSFGNGKSGEGREVKAEYDKNGEYEICLKVKSGNCTISKCKKVKISFNPDPCGLVIKYDYRIDGTSVVFISNSNLENTKYHWHIAGQNKLYEGREVKIPFEKAGVYEVCVTAFTNANCKVTECKRLEIGPACNLGADFTYTADSTGVVKVLGKSTLGDTAKYYWTYGNGKDAVGKEAKIQYEKSGEYQICLKVLTPASSTSNVQSCTQAVCKTIKVSVKIPACNLVVESESKVDGLAGIFVAKSNLDNTKYTWYVPAQNKKYEGREVKIPFEKPGTYEICLIGYTSNCEAKVCKKIEIVPTCNLGADFTYTADSAGVVKVLGKSTVGETAKYYWTFGNGKSDEGKEAKIQYAKSGEYQICIKVLKPASTTSNIQSCTQVVCKTIKVTIKDALCILKVETESKAEGLTGIFQANSNVDNTKFLWFIAGHNKQYEGREVKIPFEKPGIYEVCVTAFTTANCKVQVCKRIEIGPSCNLGADFTFSTDSTGVVKVLGKSALGDTAKYNWTFGNGKPAEGKEAKMQYEKSGEYQICLKVYKLSPLSSIQPCVQSVCKTVKVFVKTPPCNLIIETESKVDGFTGIFQAKSNVDNTKYTWYVLSQNKKYEGREVKIPFEKPGIYEVCVIGYAGICEVKVCKRIEIINTAGACNLGADFNYEVEKDVLKAKASSNGSGNVKYYWTFGNGISVEGKDATFKFDKPGEYQLCLKVTRTSASNAADLVSCTQTVCKKINIINQIECKLTPDFTYKSEGNTVTFSGKSSDEKAKYYWYARDIKMELTGKDVSFQFEKAASYEVCMIVVNGAETCKDQICKKISVGNRISVFPNPTANILNIALDENISRVTIYDQFNKVAHSGNMYDSYGNIDITHLNDGLYTVTVQLDNGEIISKRFYKK